MKAYWVSDSLKFIGAKYITYGYNQTYEGYQKRYPDKATMGNTRRPLYSGLKENGRGLANIFGSH